MNSMISGDSPIKKELESLSGDGTRVSGTAWFVTNCHGVVWELTTMRQCNARTVVAVKGVNRVWCE